MSDLIDVSRLVSEETAVWPGDTPFSRKWVMAIEEGCACNTSTFTMSAHTGTHTDAPCHFDDDAASLEKVDLELYIGRCRVIHAGQADCIRPSDIDGLDLREEERLLFRTEPHLADDAWRDDFAYVSAEVAARAAAEGLKLIGIDTPSMDPMESKTMTAHKTLLSGGVAILEGLDLSGVPEGRYELIALPLRIARADSSPVRAVLRPLGATP